MNTYLIFALSLVVLIIAANALVRFVEKLAARIKLSPLVIGATLIAIGTSLPETFVAISSISQHVPNISFGDIIGSNIANISLVFGVGILLFPVRVGTNKTQKNNLIILLLTASFVLLFFLPTPIRKSLALFLALFYVLFIIVEIAWGELGSHKEDRRALDKMHKYRGRPVVFFLGILFSLGGLIISSKYLVSSALSIASTLGVDPEVVGLSIIAIGTSLPELVTTVVSALKKEWKLLLGNVQGSNIYNLSVLGAVLILFGDGFGSAHTFSLIYLIFTTTTFFLLIRKYEGVIIPKIYGFLYLISYGVYLSFILL
jgi:cation:H+ antiporter